MSLLLPSCPECRSPLGESLFNRPDLAPCPVCGERIQIEIFPALFRPLTRGRGGEALMVEGESSCFYHPQKKAVVPCDGCGRFLCALCDCQLHREHFCPACLEVGRQKGRIKHLENQRTLYDAIALSLAVLPIITLYFTIVTAPIALYLAIRHWNTPLSIVHRTKARLVLAMLLATAQIAGWGIGAWFLFTRIKPHG
jgi:hypothetical protein